MRLFKSWRTVITIQPFEKTQLTKILSTLKMFGDPLQVLQDNRNFWLKICIHDNLLLLHNVFSPQIWGDFSTRFQNVKIFPDVGEKFCLPKIWESPVPPQDYQDIFIFTKIVDIFYDSLNREDIFRFPESEIYSVFFLSY